MAISGIIQKYKQKWASYSTKKKIACVVTGLAVILLTQLAGGSSKAVEMVKGGSFNQCPHKTVGKAANDFLGSPKWASGIGVDGPTKGLTLVNLKGTASLHGKNVDLALQFIVNEKDGSFQPNALELNGIPQPPLVILQLVNSMCER